MILYANCMKCGFLCIKRTSLLISDGNVYLNRGIKSYDLAPVPLTNNR